MRLEPDIDDPSRHIGKQVSFPVRLPFAVSADGFAIIGSDTETAAASLAGGKLAVGKTDGTETSATSGSRGRLTQASRAGAGSSASSGGNAGLGSSTTGGVKTMSAFPAGGSFYVYSFDGRLLAEYNLIGECVRDYIYMGAQLVAEYRPSTFQYYYYMNDQINSIRVVTDDSGTVVYSAAYDPYGGVQHTWANTFDPALKFSGKERDGESGLDYFEARYNDRTQYRSIGPDVAIDVAVARRNPQAWNAYALCLDSPLSAPGPSMGFQNQGGIGPIPTVKQRPTSQHSYPNPFQNPYRPNESRLGWSSLLKPSGPDIIVISSNGALIGYFPAEPVFFGTYLNEANYLLPASASTYEPPEDLFGGSLSMDALFNAPQNASIDSLWDMLNRNNGGFLEVPSDSDSGAASVVIIVIFVI